MVLLSRLRAHRLPRAASWTLAVLAAACLMAGLLLVYADRTVFDAGGFSGRAEVALQAAPVRAAVARRIVNAAVTQEPRLVAVRPVLEAAVGAVLRTAAFRSVARAALRDVHRSAFDREARTVTLTVADTGILVTQAAQELQPGLARRLPSNLAPRLARIDSGVQDGALRIGERAEQARRLAPLLLLAAALLAGVLIALSATVRSAAFRLGVAVGVAAACVACVAAIAPRVAATGLGPGDRAAVRAAAEVWLRPLGRGAFALAAAGAILALAAASVLRPVSIPAAGRRVARVLLATQRRPVLRAARAIAAGAVGLAMVVWPRTVLEIAVAAAGVLVVAWAVTEVLALTAAPEPRPAPGRRPRLRVPLAVLAPVLVAGAVAAAAVASGGEPQPPRTGRCNGFRALCDRPLDRVAFAGTHNSMAADGEAGWLFAAQDAGIQPQLDDGIRALLVDTHYGSATPNGVATTLADGSKSRLKISDPLGEQFVQTAKRLRDRIGFVAGDAREVYLCHAYCEVGATPAVAAFAQVHRFLVTHPEEVLILSIEDDTTPESTAAAIRASGLIREVYRGPARPPWPTLRDMIDRDQRVVVLVENDAGDIGWMHRQPTTMQETPYRFTTVRELAGQGTCRPNRGGTAGSLLLVNHWVDTAPAPRPSIADEVNARPFLDRRLRECREERGRLPNVVAVDFYRRGDVLGAVRALNGVR